ncbi:MAG TPA: TolC family protein, partial [Novosphingobium sp.]|nr:TolC family protein [Novosphingobium sp.]
SAQALIEAGHAGLTAVRADFYPNVDIRAFAGSSALGIGSLFTGKALVAGAGPAIHLPIFEGGALKAKYRAMVAENDMLIAQYNEAVVKAVKEAADALSSVETNRADAEQQNAMLAALEKTVALDHIRVKSGLGTRFDVLNADERLLSARQTQVNIAADGAVRRIQLLVALGGGFTPLPAAAKPLASAPAQQASSHE